MSRTLMQRPWATVLALVVMAVVVTVLITSVRSVEAQEPTRFVGTFRSSPVFVQPHYGARLAVFNFLPNHTMLVNAVFFDASTGDRIGGSGVQELLPRTGAKFDHRFETRREIFGIVHFEVDYTDVESDTSVDGSGDSSDRYPHHRVRRRAPLGASLQVLDGAGATAVYDALGR